MLLSRARLARHLASFAQARSVVAGVRVPVAVRQMTTRGGSEDQAQHKANMERVVSTYMCAILRLFFSAWLKLKGILWWMVGHATF